MSEEIILKPNEVWKYAMDHFAWLKNDSFVIGENKESGIEITLSAEDEYPVIVVTSDDEEVDYQVVKSSADCEATVSEIYDTWLSSNVAASALAKNEIDKESERENIDQRENELDEAIDWLLSEIAPDYMDQVEDLEDVFSDMKDMICEYLYTKCGISVYRPMYLENENGVDEYYDFPYPEMDI